MAKSQTVWSNSTRNTGSWTPVTPNNSTWSNESTAGTSYTYNQAGVTYNQAGYYYNFITFVANQSNNKSAVNWVQS